MASQDVGLHVVDENFGIAFACGVDRKAVHWSRCGMVKEIDSNFLREFPRVVVSLM
jgi:hypothetical protein